MSERTTGSTTATSAARGDEREVLVGVDADLGGRVFNAAFQPARTDHDRLSRDTTEVDEYVAHPLCGFGTDVVGAKDMFACSAPTSYAFGSSR